MIELENDTACFTPLNSLMCWKHMHPYGYREAICFEYRALDRCESDEHRQKLMMLVRVQCPTAQLRL